jgi:ATP-dependent DNA helicase RecG
MTGYTDTELERLLAELESDRVERKESLRGDAPTKCREAICAFANDLPDHAKPGVLFIGAHDDGAAAGLAVTDEMLRQLADMKTDGNILPPPTVTVTKHRLVGADMAVVLVWPADSPPVRYKGRVHVRIGPRRGVATAQDERVLNEKRRHRDRPFDVRAVPSATLGDLDRVRFESEYLPAMFAPDVLAANQRTYEQRLAATKMTVAADTPVPTVLGLLVLGVRTRDFLPGAYIQFLRIAGRTLSDPIADEQAIDGPVAQVLGQIDAKLASHNRTIVDLASADTERRTPLYPMLALQQILRNAVMHRSYETTYAPVRVTWYDDRVEISNPGGPFGSVTVDNFGRPGVADYRNPELAGVLRVYGFVQKFGVGIATAQKALADNGNPPAEFEVNASHVNVTLRPAP